MLLLAVLLQLASPSAEPAPSIGVRLAPDTALIARDRAGTLLVRRFCDTSGLSPCIRTVPDRTLDPGASAIVYNPFYEQPPRLGASELRYALVQTY
jgi:hypothetical protein